MPGTWTNRTDNAILDLLYGRVPLTPPSIFWVGLSTRKAWKDGSIIEPPASAGYARMGLSNQPLAWKTIDPGTRANALRINFPVPTASWGLILSMFLADDQHGGNVWLSVDFALPKLVEPPQPGPVIAPGALVIGGA